MDYKKGDRVEHTNCGYGTFVKYIDENKVDYYDDCIVKFDENALYSQGKEMVVKIGHLEKVKMKYKKAKEILTQAINYDEEDRTQQGNWMLGTEGIEAVKVAIKALEVKEPPNSVAYAMGILTDALKGDKSNVSFYYSWQSSIACTIMDNSNIEHDKANLIAIKFLELLIR